MTANLRGVVDSAWALVNIVVLSVAGGLIGQPQFRLQGQVILVIAGISYIIHSTRQYNRGMKDTMEIAQKSLDAMREVAIQHIINVSRPRP